jgi:hypothetical protein
MTILDVVITMRTSNPTSVHNFHCHRLSDKLQSSTQWSCSFILSAKLLHYSFVYDLHSYQFFHAYIQYSPLNMRFTCLLCCYMVLWLLYWSLNEKRSITELDRWLHNLTNFLFIRAPFLFSVNISAECSLMTNSWNLRQSDRTSDVVCPCHF